MGTLRGMQHATANGHAQADPMQLHSSLLLMPTVRALPAPLTWRGVHLNRRPQPGEAAAVVVQHSHQRLAVRPACEVRQRW